MKNGTEKVIKLALLILFDIISIVIACGRFLEIKGIIAYFIFAVPVVLNVVLSKKYNKIFQKVVLSLMMFMYIITGAFVLIRENSGVRVIEQKKNGKYIYITYEINPGAMGHLSYEDRTYYSLIDTDLLTVRIVKKSRHYRYRG